MPQGGTPDPKGQVFFGGRRNLWLRGGRAAWSLMGVNVMVAPHDSVRTNVIHKITVFPLAEYPYFAAPIQKLDLFLG